MEEGRRWSSEDERWLAERGVSISWMGNDRRRTRSRIEADRLRTQAMEALRLGRTSVPDEIVLVSRTASEARGFTKGFGTPSDEPRPKVPRREGGGPTARTREKSGKKSDRELVSGGWAAAKGHEGARVPLGDARTASRSTVSRQNVVGWVFDPKEKAAFRARMNDDDELRTPIAALKVGHNRSCETGQSDPRRGRKGWRARVTPLTSAARPSMRSTRATSRMVSPSVKTSSTTTIRRPAVRDGSGTVRDSRKGPSAFARRSG